MEGDRLLPTDPPSLNIALSQCWSPPPPQAEGVAVPRASTASIDRWLRHIHNWRRGRVQGQSVKEEATSRPSSAIAACRSRMAAAGPPRLQASTPATELAPPAYSTQGNTSPARSGASLAPSATSPVAPTATMPIAQEVFGEMPSSVDDETFLSMMDVQSFGNIACQFDAIDDEIASYTDGELNKKKGSRGANFNIAEDETLVRAWQAISLDPITGDEQPGATQEQRIMFMDPTNLDAKGRAYLELMRDQVLASRSMGGFSMDSFMGGFGGNGSSLDIGGNGGFCGNGTHPNIGGNGDVDGNGNY